MYTKYSNLLMLVQQCVQKKSLEKSTLVPLALCDVGQKKYLLNSQMTHATNFNLL